MANNDTATFDLFVIVWERWKTLFIFVAVAFLAGIAASLFLAAQHRATATLVPISEGQAAQLFPVTVPESILEGGNQAFAPYPGTLFDRFLVALSAEASERAETETETESEAVDEDDNADYSLNRVDEEGRRFVELEVSAPSGPKALNKLQTWIGDSEQNALMDLNAEFTNLVSRRLRDTEYRLSQKLLQEENELRVQQQRLQDELRLVSGLLENASLDSTNKDAFLLYPQPTENLFSDGLPPYLLSRDRLKAREAQLRLQLDQLADGTADGVYLPGLADLKAQKTSLIALKETFVTWVDDEQRNRALVRFSAFPVKEGASWLKRSILFGAGGVMLGLLIGLIWIVLAESVRIARERAA